MKIRTSLTITFFFTFLLNVAGQQIIPKEATVVHREAPRPCLIVSVDPESKTLKKAWIDYIDDKYGVKMKGMGLFANKELLTAEEVKVRGISSKTIDFYTEVIEDAYGSQMKVFAAHGYDSYVGPDEKPKEFKAMRKMMEQFLKTYLPKYHQNMLQDTQERITELTEETEKLGEEITKLEAEIVELENQKDEKKKLLEDNRAKLQNRQDKLETMRTALRKM